MTHPRRSTLDDRTLPGPRQRGPPAASRQRCPEWTEHNVSDPGITLIELFAWMTEMIIYRLNRVPDKLHVALLDLLGIQLEPPVAATTDAALPARGAGRPSRSRSRRRDRGRHGAHAERGGDRLPDDRGLHDPAGAPDRLRRQARRRASRTSASPHGVAKPKGADQLAVRHAAEGRRRALPRLRRAARAPRCSQVDVDCSQARGAGVDPEDPPLRWEVSDAEEPSGLARGRGARGPDRRLQLRLAATVELQLPRAAHAVHDRRASARYWVRCRLDTTTRSGATAAATYTHPPEIYAITAAPIGARHPRRALLARSTTRCSARATARRGRSSSFRYAPDARPDADETSRCSTPTPATGSSGSSASRSSRASPTDRHYVLDAAGGQIELGPAIRTPDGELAPVRRGPAEGRDCCASPATATAAGAAGNVAAGTLTRAEERDPRRRHRSRTPAGARRRRPGVARERAHARGDGDPHALPRGDRRGLRVPLRRGLAARRPRRLPAAGRGRACVRVHIVPRVAPADRQLDARRAARPTRSCSTEVAAYLDERRLIGTSVELLPGAAARRQRRRATSRPRCAPTSSASSRTSPTRSTRT